MWSVCILHCLVNAWLESVSNFENNASVTIGFHLIDATVKCISLFLLSMPLVKIESVIVPFVTSASSMLNYILNTDFLNVLLTYMSISTIEKLF